MDFITERPSTQNFLNSAGRKNTHERISHRKCSAERPFCGRSEWRARVRRARLPSLAKSSRRLQSCLLPLSRCYLLLALSPSPSPSLALRSPPPRALASGRLIPNRRHCQCRYTSTSPRHSLSVRRVTTRHHHAGVLLVRSTHCCALCSAPEVQARRNSSLTTCTTGCVSSSTRERRGHRLRCQSFLRYAQCYADISATHSAGC